MMTEKERSSIEQFLDEVDKAKAGDKTAFNGMKVVLDGEPGDDIVIPDDSDE